MVISSFKELTRYYFKDEYAIADDDPSNNNEEDSPNTSDNEEDNPITSDPSELEKLCLDFLHLVFGYMEIIDKNLNDGAQKLIIFHLVIF